MSTATNSWRIQVNQYSVGSTQVNPTAGNVGGTVIRSYKGPQMPIYIYKGQTQRILNIFGVPSASYPDIWDAIAYNSEADIWISAPINSGTGTNTALYGGVLVTKSGTIPLLSGLTSIGTFSNNQVFTPNVSFTAFPVTQTLGTGDGSTTNFQVVLNSNFKSFYNYQSIGILNNGTTINVTASNASTEILTTSPNVGSGTYNRTTGLLSFTFSVAPTKGNLLQLTYTVNESTNAYFALFTNQPQGNDQAVIVTPCTTGAGTFEIDAYLIDQYGNYNELPSAPYFASLPLGSVNTANADNYIMDVFANDDYITPVINPNFANISLTGYTGDTTYVNFSGGNRGPATTSAQWTTGWAYFQNPRIYSADIFFDCTADPSIPPIFSNLRNNYQKYKAYLLPLPNVSQSTAITTKQALSISDRGLYFYWNWGLVNNPYTSGTFYSPLMGAVGTKHAAMIDVFNGLAPAWIDEDGHGGQLSGFGILSMANDPNETQLQQLDSAQINAIVFDSTYGVMITSDRTSLTSLSDYSYIPHSRQADYCISNVISQVLVYQNVKLNDIAHRRKVASKTSAIINPLLAPPNTLLNDAAVICDLTNNTPTTLSQRKFILSVYVQFTPFSEYIVFNFVNVGQTTTVSEAIASGIPN